MTPASRNVNAALPLWTYALWGLSAAGILVTAALLSVGAERDVLLPGAAIVVPETCMMHARFGLDCPGCGLTRSFIHLMHGNFSAAWQLSPAGILVFAYTWLQIPLALLGVGSHLSPFEPSRRLLSRDGCRAMLQSCLGGNQLGLVILVLALSAQWIWRLLPAL
ncbi:hypothetical protein Q31a_33120 [Aureliella helgolandensis]|uniref:DUF2752 domain-containing protein n=1 Tax=Aureliella helgolandensis TaxID=2527968 RepID=A0A518G8U1_9BACT|nr:hypothetical protein Q31a_33120 [Aureliella helgolandensis]